MKLTPNSPAEFERIARSLPGVADLAQLDLALAAFEVAYGLPTSHLDLAIMTGELRVSRDVEVWCATKRIRDHLRAVTADEEATS